MAAAVKKLTEGAGMEQPLLLKFNRPYLFEGAEYTEVDLSGLEDITASDMIRAQRTMTGSGNVEMIPEMTIQYACIIGAEVSGKPIEFFNSLPAKEAIKLKNMVTGFFYDEG
jgi:hypothetical protein